MAGDDTGAVMEGRQAGLGTSLPLRPGDGVELLVTRDFYRDIVDSRASRFWRQDQDGVTCAQTQPPLGRDQVGQTLEFTFLTPAPTSAGAPAPPRRLGYQAILLALLNGGLGGEAPAPGLLLSGPGQELEEMSLRRFHRVEVRGDMGIYLIMQPHAGHPRLHNFSLGGLLASFAGQPQLEHGQPLQVNLIFSDGSRVVAEALVNRVAFDPLSQRTFLGLGFSRLPVASARVLQRKISRYSCPSQGPDLERMDRG
ncbi:MAG: PilZ domain-containing protein [Pseudomonadota bacterium]